MNSTTEDFIRTFEELSREVNRRAGLPDSHAFEIAAASQRDKGVYKDKEMLRYIRDVRNAIQHPKHRSPGHGIEVSSGFLEEVKELLKSLQSPKTASSVGVRRGDLMTAKPSDMLGDLADEMKRTGFSHLPILGEEDVVAGVFNEAAVLDYLISDGQPIVCRETTVEEMMDHCRLEAAHTETFKFVKPSTPVDDLVAHFRALETPMTRVGAVFVTPAGKPTERLTHLITPWDVLDPNTV